MGKTEKFLPLKIGMDKKKEKKEKKKKKRSEKMTDCDANDFKCVVLWAPLDGSCVIHSCVALIPPLAVKLLLGNQTQESLSLSNSWLAAQLIISDRLFSSRRLCIRNETD